MLEFFNIRLALLLLLFTGAAYAQAPGCGATNGGVPLDNSKCGPAGVPYTTITPAVNAASGGTAISACGATLASNTNYYLTTSIGSDPTAVCLTNPGAANVHIDLQGNTITGVVYANDGGNQQGFRVFNGTINCSTSGPEGGVGPPATMACLTINNNAAFSISTVSVFHHLTITNSFNSGTNNSTSTGGPFVVVADYGNNTWTGTGPEVIFEYNSLSLSGNNYNSAREGAIYALGNGPFLATNNILNLSAGAGTAQGIIFYGSSGGSRIVNNECIAALTAYGGSNTSTARCFFFDFSTATVNSPLEIGNNYVTANDNRCFRFRDSQFPYIHDNFCGTIRLGGASSGTLGAVHLGDPDPFNGGVTAISCTTPATSANACTMTLSASFPFTGHTGDLMTLSGFTPSSLNETVTIGTGLSLTTIHYASNTTANNGVSATGFGDMEYSNTMNGMIASNTFQLDCTVNQQGIVFADRTTTGNVFRNNTIKSNGNCGTSSFTGAIYQRYLNIAKDSFVLKNTTYANQIGPNSSAVLLKTSNGPSPANSDFGQYCNTLSTNGVTDGDSGWQALASCSTNIYFASAAAGSNNGTSCANAYAWNDATNGLTVAGNWIAGNTYHLCGTITFGTNVSGITALASGTAQAPIIVVFENGAIMQSPQFAGGSASGPVGTGCNGGAAGGFVIPSSVSYIILDGQNTGIIQNTANGNGLTNDTSSVGVYAGGDFTMVRNLIVKQIYQWPSGPANDTNGGCSSDIIVNNSANYVKMCGNYLYSAQQGFDFSPSGATISYTPSIDGCSGNSFGNIPNFDVSYNTLDDHAWMAHTNGSGIVLFHDNQFGLMNKQTTGTCAPSSSVPCGWFNWTGSSSFHLDGLFVVGNSSSTYIADIFWNFFQGDTSKFSTTTGVYCTYTTPTNSGGICNEYENVFYVANNTAFGGTAAGNIVNAFSSQSSPVNGPHKIYANDIVQSWNICNDTSIQGVGFDFQDNIFVSNNVNGNIGYFYGGCTSGQNLAANMNFDYNLYAGSRQAVVGPNGGFSMWGCPPSSCSAISFATWQTNCAASTSGVTGCDAHSLFNTAMTYPAFSGQTTIGNDSNITDASNFYLLSSSPARGVGNNLTSQCPTLIGLCSTPPEFFGVGSTCGTGCVARPASGSWDMGAFQFVAAPPPPANNAPAILFSGTLNASGTVGAN